MSITPLKITGVSSFSDDFQTVLTRAVNIAKVPVTVLQNQQSDLISRKQLLTAFDGVVDSLASTVKELGKLGANKALAVTTSNGARVTVTNTGVTGAATYTINEITSVAKAASETTVSGFATANATQVDADGTLQLVLGSTTQTITLAAGQNHLQGLRDAINALGLGVAATIVNTGTGGTPHYLSLTATATGAKTLQLRSTVGDSGSNLLTTANQGADAIFKLNGLSLTKTDNVVTDAIPGLTFTIQSTTSVGETVTLTAASSRADVATQLQNLVTHYNNLRGLVNAQVGEDAGLLSGDFIVRHIQSEMRKLVNYEATGTIKSLAALGIELDKEGKMSFNSTRYYALSSTQFEAAFTFLGSETTSFGGLSKGLLNIGDPVTGLIKAQQDKYDDADKRISTQIAAIATRINFMQDGLSLKLQQADALLASLESQQTVLTASLDALKLSLFGKKES